MGNVETVRAIYEAFGRGDAEGVLSQVSDDALWDFNGGRPADVPWHQPAMGKAGVGAFLGTLANGMDIQAFEPLAFAHSDNAVAVQVHIAYVVKRSGKRVDQLQVHWWELGADGKVTRLQHFEDTRQVVEASR